MSPLFLIISASACSSASFLDFGVLINILISSSPELKSNSSAASSIERPAPPVAVMPRNDVGNFSTPSKTLTAARSILMLPPFSTRTRRAVCTGCFSNSSNATSDLTDSSSFQVSVSCFRTTDIILLNKDSSARSTASSCFLR